LPRKPNYKFERRERERLKAEKKAARLQAKADRRNQKAAESDAADNDTDGAAAAPLDDAERDRETD
jgi:hypothetical protein